MNKRLKGFILLVWGFIVLLAGLSSLRRTHLSIFSWLILGLGIAVIWEGIKIIRGEAKKEPSPPPPGTTQLSTSPPYRYCPECGTELKPNAKFCHKCGAKIMRKEENTERKSDIFEKGYELMECKQKDYNIIFTCPVCDHKGTIQRTSLSPTDISLPLIDRRKRMLANFFSLLISAAVAIFVSNFVALWSGLLGWISFFIIFFILHFVLKGMLWRGLGVIEVSTGMTAPCPNCGNDMFFVAGKSGGIYYLVKPIKE